MTAPDEQQQQERQPVPPRPPGPARPAEKPSTGGTAARGDAMSQRLATQIEQDVETPLPWWSIAKKVILSLIHI